MSTTVSAQILNLKMQTYFIFEALYGLKVSNRLIYANIQILRKLFWKNVFCFFVYWKCNTIFGIDQYQHENQLCAYTILWLSQITFYWFFCPLVLLLKLKHVSVICEVSKINSTWSTQSIVFPNYTPWNEILHSTVL